MIDVEISTHVTQTPITPTLRGVSHQWGFLVAAAAGIALVVFAPAGTARVAAAIYVASLCSMLGASALYHRVPWGPRGASIARRLDHSMIFVMIAGTYTPFALLVMDGALADFVLIAAWTGAALGVLFTTVFTHAATWLRSVLYALLGWASLIAAPQIFEHAGIVAVALLALGGLLYTVGALVYVLQRPDPIPGVFGFHEVFHAFVIAAAVTHYVVIAAYALPAG